jgi:hypothetical protein
MCTAALTPSARFDRFIPSPEWLGEVWVRISRAVLVRQLGAALALSAAAIAAMSAAASRAGAADLTIPQEQVVVPACPREVVIIYDKEGRPTVPARTPYYYCMTGTTLLPGQIPAPPEYCCP